MQWQRQRGPHPDGGCPFCKMTVVLWGRFAPSKKLWLDGKPPSHALLDFVGDLQATGGGVTGISPFDHSAAPRGGQFKRLIWRSEISIDEQLSGFLTKC